MFRKKNTASVLPIDAEDIALAASVNWTSLQEKVAKGDLSVRVSVTSTAPPAMAAFNAVMDHYERDIIALTNSLNQAINSSAKQNNRLHELADDSKKLSNGMQRIAAAVEELSSNIEEIAGNATQLNEQIHSVEEVASTSSMKVSESANMAQNLGVVVGTLQERMGQLTGSISSITHLIQLIREIAEQTNLLALNASIEAARAGEQGRGFSVVANEVKKLSDNTQRAVSEVVNQVNTIQSDTKNTNRELGSLTQDTHKTSQISEETKTLINTMLTHISHSNEQMRQMAPAIQEHSSVFQDIASTVTELSGVTQEESVKIHTSATDLFSLVNSLEDVRSRYSLYRLGFDHNEFLELALTDHLLLNWHLRAMLQGLTKLDEAKIGEHRLCRLGKWYYGEGQPIFGHHPAFIELEQHHEKIHHTAKEMIIAYKNDNRQKAESLYQVIDQEIGPMMVQVIKNIK